jgi:hypothetical protein
MSQDHCRVHQSFCCMTQPAATAAGGGPAGGTAGGAAIGSTAGLTKKPGGTGLCLGVLFTIITVGL